jgi:cytochrome c oxidase subunit 1
MSAAVTDARDVAGHHGGDAGTNYLTAKKGLLSWLLTVDHKRIGLMYFIATTTFFAVGGLLALVLRVELFNPGTDFLNATSYNKVFTLHGAIMTFLFLVVVIPASLGNFLLPLMIGAKDVAFPKLNLASFHIYILGALFFLWTVIAGSLDTGWTFYTPYSTRLSDTAVPSAILGAFILGWSSILTGINFIVTVHKMRAPGMTWHRLPLMVWALYATALIQVLATPVLGVTLLMVTAEKMFNIGIFDPALGGDPVLFQHFFWFYSHPVVYIMIVPAFGIISEVVAVHSQKRIFGYRPIAYSSVSIAVIGFFVWGHHMFVSGQSKLSSTIFSFLTFAIAVPTAIKVFSWVATMWKGSVSLNGTMMYAFNFLFLFTIGGLTGMFLGTMATDVHLHDTYYVVAHFHFVMVGGTFVGFLMGLHHWWPKMFGVMLNETLTKVGCFLVWAGFNITFIAQFVMGSQGMPRRYYFYLDQYTFWHRASTVGSFVLAAGLFLTLGYMIHSLFKGKPAPANPWNAKSLEWSATTAIPDEHNFSGQPVIHEGPYEFDAIDESMGARHA